MGLTGAQLADDVEPGKLTASLLRGGPRGAHQLRKKATGRRNRPGGGGLWWRPEVLVDKMLRVWRRETNAQVS
jgi:hypothetical protein